MERTYDSHEVSEAIIRELYESCAASGIRLLVAAVTDDPSTKDMLRYCQSRGVAAADISVDLSAKGNTNEPFDSHLSAAANREYARRLAAALCEAGVSGAYCVK